MVLVDCIAYAFLDALLLVPSPLHDYMQSKPRLLAFVRRMAERCATAQG